MTVLSFSEYEPTTSRLGDSTNFIKGEWMYMYSKGNRVESDNSVIQDLAQMKKDFAYKMAFCL